MSKRKAIVLVGHGAIPKDYPRERLARMKALRADRRSSDEPPSDEERRLENELRNWPRTPETDPYREGMEGLGRALRAHLKGAELHLAYNEFCAPTVEQVVDRAVSEGLTRIVVLPTMLTPGGVHSEVDIPEALEKLRDRWPEASIRYAWPVKASAIAAMLGEHLERFTA